MKPTAKGCEIPEKDHPRWILSCIDHGFKACGWTSLVKMSKSLKTKNITSSCEPWSQTTERVEIHKTFAQ